jgi:5-methylcytosine-specific restriction endonuclease McrA
MFNLSPSLFERSFDCITVEFLLSGDVVMTEEEMKARRRAYYLARTPEQKAAYATVAAEGRAIRREAHIAERAARGLLPGHVLPTPTPEEVLAAAREKSARYRAANPEKERLRHRVVKRKQAAARAAAEGREPNLDFDRPKASLLSEDEKRERRRIKSAKYRLENLERTREINRNSMKRATDAKAIADGREPGKIGPPKQFTEAEKREKRRLKTTKWNEANKEIYLERAKLRERAKRRGTFVSKALPRLTDEERRLTEVAWAAIRRTRVRANGGKFTREDIARLLLDQDHRCMLCGDPFGEDGFHVDHRIPVSRGGTSDPSNLQLAHPTCNLKKGAALLEENRLVAELKPIKES